MAQAVLGDYPQSAWIHGYMGLVASHVIAGLQDQGEQGAQIHGPLAAAKLTSFRDKARSSLLTALRLDPHCEAYLIAYIQVLGLEDQPRPSLSPRASSLPPCLLHLLFRPSDPSPAPLLSLAHALDALEVLRAFVHTSPDNPTGWRLLMLMLQQVPSSATVDAELCLCTRRLLACDILSDDGLYLALNLPHRELAVIVAQRLDYPDQGKAGLWALFLHCLQVQGGAYSHPEDLKDHVEWWVYSEQHFLFSPRCAREDCTCTDCTRDSSLPLRIAAAKLLSVI